MRYVSSLTEASRHPQLRGLSGARSIQLLSSQTRACPVAADESDDMAVTKTCHVLAISGSRPHSDLPCGLLPPLLGPAATSESTRGPLLARPRCVDVSFEFERVLLSQALRDTSQQDHEGTNVRLLREPAAERLSGVLHDVHFELAPGSVGSARYRITPMSQGMNVTVKGVPLLLDLIVLPVNRYSSARPAEAWAALALPRNRLYLPSD